VGDEQSEYGTSVEHFDEEEAARKGRYDMIGYGKMHILEERRGLRSTLGSGRKNTSCVSTSATSC
jgi:hypothetical protein